MPRPSKPPSEPAPSAGSARRSVASKDSPLPRDVVDGAGVRVLCVDDHAVLVEGLRAQFAIEGRIRIIGRLATAEKLLEEVVRLKPDIVLLDIEMPGPDVFGMADRMRHLYPKLRFVFLSAHIRDGYLAAAYKCGAWGYFGKGDELEDIVAGIDTLARSAAGTFVLGPKVKDRCGSAPVGGSSFASREQTRPKIPLDSLSAREMEVLRLIGKGRSRVEIAKELSRSVKTIDGHQERMMKKLSVGSRSDLMRLAIREGLAEA